MNTTKLETLHSVWRLNNPSVSDIAQEVDTSRPNAQKHLNSLKEKGLIRVQETNHTHIREVTDEGEERLKDELSDLRKVNSSEDQGDPYFVHFFSVICEFPNPDFLPEDWRESFREFEELEVSEQKDFNRIQMKHRDWVYRLTGRSLEIQIRNEITGEDFRTLKDRAWNKAEDGLEFLNERFEKEFGEKIPRDQLTLRIKSQHIGARRKHLARAFIGHLDKNTELSPRDFQVLDEENEIRIYADKSGPGGSWESESGNGGRINGRMDTAEDDNQLLQDFTWSLLDHPGEAKRLVETPARVDQVEQQAQKSIQKATTVQEQIGDTVTKVEGLDDQVSEMRQAIQSNSQLFQELQESRREEKKTRKAFIEQVRSINNLAQSNQELLQNSVPQVEQQGEVIQEMASRLKDLEEKVQNIGSSEKNVSENYGNDVRLRHRKKEAISEVPHNAEITSIQISTMREQEGKASDEKEVSLFEELPEYAVDPSSLQERMKFKDLREDKLLEIQGFELQENSEGFTDMASIRVAGTLRIWNTMPRSELARLLGTGRFEIVDRADGEKEEQGSDGQKDSESSVIFKEDASESSESDAHHFI